MGGARRGFDLGADVGAGAKTGIQQPHPVEPRQRSRVIGQTLGLAAHRLLPLEILQPLTEPGQIIHNVLLELGPTAPHIDVLHTQQKPSAARARAVPGHQRRMGVAEMQVPAGAGGETGDDHSIRGSI